jgi:hypothetical protein
LAKRPSWPSLSMRGSAKRLSTPLEDMPHSRHASNHPDRVKHCDTRVRTRLWDRRSKIAADPFQILYQKNYALCGNRLNLLRRLSICSECVAQRQFVVRRRTRTKAAAVGHLRTNRRASVRCRPRSLFAVAFQAGLSDISPSIVFSVLALATTQRAFVRPPNSVLR